MQWGHRLFVVEMTHVCRGETPTIKGSLLAWRGMLQRFPCFWKEYGVVIDEHRHHMHTGLQGGVREHLLISLVLCLSDLH
jgi:hypothetical protein